MFKLVGNIQFVSPVETVGAKQFPKRRFVVHNAENYEHQYDLELTLSGDKHVNLVNESMVGAPVEVSFSVSSRKWTGKDGKERWFTDVTAWGVKALANVAPQPQQQAQYQPQPQQSQQPTGNDGSLPF